MPERLFLFLALEFPWELGPARRALPAAHARRRPAQRQRRAQPERVVVLGTLGAPRRAGAALGAITLPRVGSRRARRPRETTPDPAPVATARATIVDPVSVSAERQAQAWLAGIDAERETQAALDSAQPRPLRPPHRHRRPPHARGRPRPGAGDPGRLGRGRAGGRRAVAARARAALERLPAHASGARPCCAPRSASRSCSARAIEELLCEELTLRARLDLDHGRLAARHDRAGRGSDRRARRARRERPTRRSPHVWTSCGPCTMG